MTPPVRYSFPVVVERTRYPVGTSVIARRAILVAVPHRRRRRCCAGPRVALNSSRLELPVHVPILRP